MIAHIDHNQDQQSYRKMHRTTPFLALTSDRRFWDTTGEVVLLGEWCLDEATNDAGIRFPFTTIESPWNRNRDIDKVAAYLEEFSEKVLVHLSRELDRVHGLEFGLKPWRLLAGNWVLHAVHTLYDRFLLIDEAMRLHGELWTRVPLLRESAAFSTVRSFKEAQIYPDTALLLLGRLADAMGVSCEYVSSPHVDQECSLFHQMTSQGFLQRFKRAIKDTAKPWLFWGRPILFCDAGVNRSTVKDIGIQGIGVATTEFWHPSRCNPVAVEQRKSLFENLEVSDQFQQIALKIFPHLLPTSLLEDFALWHSKTTGLSWGYKAKVLITANGFSGYELFALRAIRLSQRGCLLVGIQHGGGYGLFRYCPEELHETKCADRYLTWGWRNEEKKHQPMPSLHLAQVLRKPHLHEAQGKGVLLVTTGRPHLTHRVQSHPLSGQLSRYFTWQERFYEGLCPAIKRDFFLLPYSADFVAGSPWWKKRSITIAEGPLLKTMNKYRVLIFDHNATGILEALALNFPTLVCWDPELWELRDEAAQHFENLSRAGIFHATPESAAAKLNNIYEAVGDWWRSALVQSARKEFCDIYARSSNGWQKEWADLLEQISTMPHPTSSCVSPSCRPNR